MVKNLSCVSCGCLKRLPHTFTTERESAYILRIQKRQPNARWSQTRFSRLNLKATYFAFGSILQVDNCLKVAFVFHLIK